MSSPSSSPLQPVRLGATRQSRERGRASPAPPTAAPPRQLPASAPATITSTVQIQTLQTVPVPVSDCVSSHSPAPDPVSLWVGLGGLK